MKETIRTFAYGDDLFVFPFLDDNAPDHWMGGSASIQATCYPSPAVHCNVYFDRHNPLTRDQWKQLYAAVERCWQWLHGERR